MKKKILAIVLVTLLLAAAGVYWYLQVNKKGLVKHFIQQTISDKTDSLYYLKYDSSMIDEVNGNAYFRNIYLQSDSEQAALLKSTDSLPNVLINIFIKSVSASGIDMQAYLENKVVHAKSIIIDGPIIQIINTGANQLKLEDTLAIYKKMVGEFSSVKADHIEIRACTFISKNKNGVIQTRMSNANILLTKFKVDSTKDYSNILSYFIDNISATVDSIYFKGKQQYEKIYLKKVDYNSSNKSLDIAQIVSFTNDNNIPTSKLNTLHFNNLNVNAFITQHKLQTGKVSSAGGLVTIYIAKKSEANSKIKTKPFEFPEAFFDEVEIGSLQLGNTTLIIKDKQHPEKAAITVTNVKFSVSNEINVLEGNNLKNIIDRADWKLSTDGFSLLTKDNMYTIAIKGIELDRKNQSASIKQVNVTPRITESEFVRKSVKQGDFYNIQISNIKLNGLNINKAINESIIDIQQAALSLSLKVYNDRTLPVNHESKVGKYPHQMLLKLQVPVYIKKAIIQNSYISYRERAEASKEVGNVLFTGVNATIENITNIPERIKQQSVLRMKAIGTFLNKGQASTQWNLQLGANNGAFDMTGQITQMDAAAFNAISLPLGMTSVSGQINRLNFSMTGNDLQAQGKLTLLYQNLNIETFKKDMEGDSLKAKKWANKLSNALIKNDNPSKGVVRDADFTYNRELNKSFFNLIWKSIFEGVQKTVMSKNALNLQKNLKQLKKGNKKKKK